MATAVHFDSPPAFRIREFADLRRPHSFAFLFGLFLALQALSLLTLGLGRWGCGLAEAIVALANFVALIYVWLVFRRTQGITALFWFLFTVVLAVWLVPNLVQPFDTLSGQTTLSDSTWRLLYCLYGAPILMMLFLPIGGREPLKFEIFLDLFQIAVVVALIYSTFFFLPAQRMLPGDALLHNASISNVQSLLLLVAGLVRVQFARTPGTRRLLLRFTLFLLVCAVATFIGDWIDLHQYVSAAAWYELVWTLNMAAAAFIAITWNPSADLQDSPAPTSFMSFLSTNLLLVAMLTSTALLSDRWKQAHGLLLTAVAVAASLLAFTFRLALTQFHQDREIAHRKAAQQQLSASHQEVGRLLADARCQTDEITQISELGSLLHACTSREEIFRLVPDRLRRLFPGASGSIALLSTSKSRVESVAKWGISTPDPIFTPDQCWALRRGAIHVHAGGPSDPHCAHLLGDGPSVCIPLIVNGEAIGTLSLLDDDLSKFDFQKEVRTPPVADPEFREQAQARRRHLATAVAEHIALAVANLSLRESLRVQAVRDPLTGLYNRRYMHEFLDRELHSARRKHRPLAVMMLDLDHFKQYNDTFGHAAGDKTLAAVGEALLRSVRAEDIACRYGGEEFTLILPECSLQQALVRAEQIRARLKERRSQVDGQPADVLTVSIGVAAFDETTDRVDLLLNFADEALYEAKRAGRDRVVVARPPCALSPSDFAKKTPPPTA
ncbi:MAG: sensor domain-containing diguanylate cyclase [Terriglobales bacterium]